MHAEYGVTVWSEMWGCMNSLTRIRAEFGVTCTTYPTCMQHIDYPCVVSGEGGYINR